MVWNSSSLRGSLSRTNCKYSPDSKAGQSLPHRPIEPLRGALRQLGADCHAEDSAVIVNGGHLKGEIENSIGSAAFIGFRMDGIWWIGGMDPWKSFRWNGR